VALYASSMPTGGAARSNLTAEQVEAWAAEGLRQLGPVQVRRLTWRTRRGASPELKAIWPSARRERAAYDVAWEYRAAHPWPAPEQVNPHLGRHLVGITYKITRNQWDVGYAQRYAGLQASCTSRPSCS
jgi:hypothetical protein